MARQLTPEQCAEKIRDFIDNNNGDAAGAITAHPEWMPGLNVLVPKRKAKGSGAFSNTPSPRRP